jgi:hypothetical protein
VQPPKVAKNSMPPVAKPSARAREVMRPAIGKPLPQGLPGDEGDGGGDGQGG